LDAYRDEHVFERARAMEQPLRTRLDELQRRHRTIGEVRGVGAFFGLELVSDRKSREPLVAWQGKETLNGFFADALARGLYVFGRYNAVVIAPPLIAGDAELDEAAELLDASLTKLEEA